MGLLSWLFPSADDRIAKARTLLKQERWADARLEVLDLDHPQTETILVEAEGALCQMNIEHAVSWCRADDEDRVNHHMELANNFHRGGHEESFRLARREMRQIREERRLAAQQKAEAEAKALLDIDLGGFQVEEDDFHIEGADDALKARLHLLLEGYPKELRATVGDLGPDFAQAVLDLEEGRADLALQALVRLPEEQPLVHWECARAAYALGDPAATVRALRAFEKHAGEHYPMGQNHSGVFLAQCQAESGDLQGAIQTLRALRARDPQLGATLLAQLLEATGELPEAESILTGLIRLHPKTMGLYKLLARVRVSGGHRMQAMRALETGLQKTHCPPGQCGYQPPDQDAIRTLATLYFEDGIESARANELADQAMGLIGQNQPTWEDAYLHALRASAQNDPVAKRLITVLHEQTPPADARRQAKLQSYLPLPA